MSDNDLIRRGDAIAACAVGPSDEWARATKSGYMQAATDCTFNVLRIPAAVSRAQRAALAASPLPHLDVRQWDYYPIEMPVTADGCGPATVGVDAVQITYELWDKLLTSHASFDNLPDAINEAMRLSFGGSIPADPVTNAGCCQPVKVKPLVWFEAELPSRGGGKFTSEGYTIRRIEGLWLLDFAGNGKTKWRWVDLDAAKAAAQADYEGRILAALEWKTIVSPEVQALVDALEFYADRDNYEPVYERMPCDCCTDIYEPVKRDEGDTARAALAAWKDAAK